MSEELLLIDFSSVARPMWEACKTSEERSSLAAQIVARVHALAAQHPHCALCMDSGKSFRHDLDSAYKGSRPEAEAAMHHQFDCAAEALKADGFVVWAVKGFETDDIVATATTHALDCDGDVLIVSSDKDLCALLGPKVRMKKTTDGSIVDEAVLFAKFGVRPEQMTDYLSLVGDASDNIKGAKGIGGVNAAKLLATFGTLDALYAAMDKGEAALTDGIKANLTEFRDRLPLVRQLLTLRSDVEIPFHEIATERAVKPIAELPPMFDEPFEFDPAANGAQKKAPAAVAPPKTQAAIKAAFTRESNGQSPTPQAASPTQPAPERERVAPRVESSVPPASPPEDGPAAPPSQALIVREPAPAEWERALEPRTMQQASWLAAELHASRLFSAYGTPQGVLATVLAGRELGMPAMASLRAFHVIEGRPTLSAGTIQSLVLRSGKARYFRCKERTDTKATFETQRGDDPPMALTFTVEDGRRAFTGDDKAWVKSGWGKNPADMCVARAATKLARLVYPDVVSGLYAPEEFE